MSVITLGTDKTTFKWGKVALLIPCLPFATAYCIYTADAAADFFPLSINYTAWRLEFMDSFLFLSQS